MSISLEFDNALKLFLGGGAVLLGMIIGILLLVGNKKQRRAEVFLGLLILAYALMLLNMLLAESGIMSKYKFLYFLPIYYTLSFGPLVYFFVKSKVQPGFRYRRIDLLHWVLPIFQACFFFAIGFRDVEFKSWMWRNFIAPFYQDFEFILFTLSFTAYLYVSFRMLKQGQANNHWKERQSKWMFRLLLYLAIFFGISAVYDIANNILWDYYQINLYNIDWLSFPKNLAAALMGYWLCLNGFIQLKPEKVSLITSTKPNIPTVENPEEAERLRRLMQEQKPYLNPDLNLQMLASDMDLTTNSMSSLINRHFQKNFNDFVNHYRVEEVKQLIQDPRNEAFTLLSLGLQAGFNSKSTFNRAFKEIEGMTPNAFRINHLKSLK
ncbi:MAG: AraC family transcriptional regulator [Bacteroidota bacterium]